MIALDRIGSIVGYETINGGFELSTWVGKTIKIWAKFDTDIHEVPMVFKRDHMTEAFDINEPRPEGALEVICFDNW